MTTLTKLALGMMGAAASETGARRRGGADRASPSAQGRRNAIDGGARGEAFVPGIRA